MTKFVAIKVHYDHRKQLPTHQKCSVPPRYKTYRDFFEKGVGGDMRYYNGLSPVQFEQQTTTRF